jgi:outer membrane protein assembly factor BamB
VAVTGDLVLLARADSPSVATGGIPEPGPGPWLEALARDDGAPAWQVDRPSVLLTTGPDGSSYVLDVGGRPRVTALDAEGHPRWSTPVPAGFRSAWLWADRLVLRGPDPAGGTVLRALDTSTGKPAWTVRGRQAPPVGDDPRPGLGTPLVEDGTAWVPAPDGLLEIDVATGRATRHDSTARVDELLRLGDPADGRVAVVSGTALLVTL